MIDKSVRNTVELQYNSTNIAVKQTFDLLQEGVRMSSNEQHHNFDSVHFLCIFFFSSWTIFHQHHIYLSSMRLDIDNYSIFLSAWVLWRRGAKRLAKVSLQQGGFLIFLLLVPHIYINPMQKLGIFSMQEIFSNLLQYFQHDFSANTELGVGSTETQYNIPTSCCK